MFAGRRWRKRSKDTHISSHKHNLQHRPLANRLMRSIPIVSSEQTCRSPYSHRASRDRTTINRRRRKKKSSDGRWVVQFYTRRCFQCGPGELQRLFTVDLGSQTCKAAKRGGGQSPVSAKYRSHLANEPLLKPHSKVVAATSRGKLRHVVFAGSNDNGDDDDNQILPTSRCLTWWTGNPAKSRLDSLKRWKEPDGRVMNQT